MENNKKDKICALSMIKEQYPDDFTIEWDDPNDTSSYPEDDNYKEMLDMMKDFTTYLIEGKYLIELPDDEPEKDCMVMYFDDDNDLKYSAIVREPKGKESIVQGRWGSYSATIKHKLWHVPSSYGTKVKFYKALTPEQSEALFREFLIKNPFKYDGVLA